MSHRGCRSLGWGAGTSFRPVQQRCALLRTASRERSGSPGFGHCSVFCRDWKTDGLISFFSVEIWLRVDGDEESQLQPGGEEVRAPRTPPFLLPAPANRQPRSQDSLRLCFPPPPGGECEILTQLSSAQRSKGQVLSGEPGGGVAEGRREDKSPQCLWTPACNSLG